MGKTKAPVYMKNPIRKRRPKPSAERPLELLATSSNEETLATLGLGASDAPSFASMALKYLHSGDDETALAASHIAIAADPSSSDVASAAAAWFVRGCVHGRRKQNFEALHAFTRVVELRPDDTAAWVFIGELHLSTLSYQFAALAFERALKLDPKGATAAGQRAHALVAKTLLTV